MMRHARGKRRIAGAALRALALALTVFTTAASAAAYMHQPPRSAAQDEFVPVDQLPNQESLPAVPFVIAAYAAAWLAVFVYLWSIWQRLGRVEREITEVSRRIETGARR